MYIINNKKVEKNSPLFFYIFTTVQPCGIPDCPTGYSTLDFFINVPVGETLYNQLYKQLFGLISVANIITVVNEVQPANI